MTNYEKIKCMSFFEMIEFMTNIGNCETCSRRGCASCTDVESCRPYIKEWLDSEAKEEVKEDGNQIV